MWPSLSRNLTRLFDVCSPHHPREHMTFEESVYLRFTKRRSKRLEAPLAACNAARNHSISGGAAFLHEFRIVLFLRSSRLYICTTPPCHVNYSWSDQELLVRGRSRVSPVARSTLTCITPCRITLGFRHVERVHTCLRTVICVRVGVTQPRCPHEAAPLIHRARGSSLIEERATVMWNMITHEQIIRVITIALAGQQPARRLQGIWFYLWTMDHGIRAGCPFASLMLVDRFGSEIPGIGGRGSWLWAEFRWFANVWTFKFRGNPTRGFASAHIGERRTLREGWRVGVMDIWFRGWNVWAKGELLLMSYLTLEIP